MSQPKGKVPAHIKSKLFDHPAKSSRIILMISEVEDPRQPSCNFHYSLVTRHSSPDLRVVEFLIKTLLTTFP